MNIRNAEMSDLDAILDIYAYARRYMEETGNPTQWQGGYPARALLEQDIEKGHLYVMEQDEGKDKDRKTVAPDGILCGVFAFIIGEDPTYAVIEDGQWKNDRPYGTIHRIAGNGTQTGLLQSCVDFGRSIIDEIRIDTHADNKVMQHLIVKCGFTYCGRIYATDGTPRLAYQL